MQGEVRVTVIATGFDRAVTGDQPLTARLGRGRRAQLPAARGPGLDARHGHARAAAAQPVQRAGARASARRPPAGPTEVPEMEIPTFIRRQMD